MHTDCNDVIFLIDKTPVDGIINWLDNYEKHRDIAKTEIKKISPSFNVMIEEILASLPISQINTKKQHKKLRH